ncbi:hypothetical protein ACMYR2_3746 [Nitrobacter sp. TKz-YC01]
MNRRWLLPPLAMPMPERSIARTVIVFVVIIVSILEALCPLFSTLQ